jgi:NTE family protein
MPERRKPARRTPTRGPDSSARPEKIALLLQGGGALGAYQAGLYAGLCEADLRPEWIAGISIGAINGAIIAGNEPDRVVERLHEFWMRISESATPFPFVEEWMETAFNRTAAATTLMFGAPGFFRPRLNPPWTRPCVAPEDLSYYDATDLKRTLADLVSFKRLNDRNCDRRIRLSIGAVGVLNGNFDYFDSDHQEIGPEHIMASGALPPGLPPVWASHTDKKRGTREGW